MKHLESCSLLMEVVVFDALTTTLKPGSAAFNDGAATLKTAVRRKTKDFDFMLYTLG